MELTYGARNMTRIFFDTEFTGLHQNTTLISIGCVAEDGREFYAELTDYDEDQINKMSDHAREKVFDTLIYKDGGNREITNGAHTGRQGDTKYIADELSKWLSSFGTKVQMWSDTLAYDWVLFNQLWGHAFNIPDCVYYIPFDLATLFLVKGIDPDINREEFSGLDDDGLKHNAQWDAKVIRECYLKLNQELKVNNARHKNI